MSKVAVTTHSIIPASDAQALWEIYSSNLGRAQLKSPFRQYMVQEEFEACLLDSSFIKIVLSQDDVYCGILLLATDLNKVSWLSGEYFAHKYPYQFHNHTLLYYAGVAVTNPNGVHGIAGILALHQEMFKFYKENGFQVFFHDYSRAVHATSGLLGKFIAKKFKATATEVDQMHFWEIQ